MLFKEAQALLRAKGWINDSGGLENINKYLHWIVDSGYICLDGDFTAKELEAIFIYMKDYKQPEAASP